MGMLYSWVDALLLLCVRDFVPAVARVCLVAKTWLMGLRQPESLSTHHVHMVLMRMRCQPRSHRSVIRMVSGLDVVICNIMVLCYLLSVAGAVISQHTSMCVGY